MLSQQFSDWLSFMNATFYNAQHEGHSHSICNVMLGQGTNKITCVKKYIFLYLPYLVKISESFVEVHVFDRAEEDLDLLN